MTASLLCKFTSSVIGGPLSEEPRARQALNEALEASLAPSRDAARALGADAARADLIMADAFAHAAGVLLLAHVRRRAAHARARSDQPAPQADR